MGYSTTWLNTITLPEFTDLVSKKFKLVQQMVKPNAEQLFIREDVTANSGDTRRYDEVDTETFANLKPQGSDATKAQVGVGYSKTMTAKRVAKEIDISWEMRHYNKEPQVIGELTSLSQFCPQRLELDLTHRFTFASASSYTDMDGTSVTTTMGDGNPLIYATHALKFVSTTYNNRVTGDPTISQGGLESAEEIFNNEILSNFGEKRVMEPNKIITGRDPSTVNAVKKILQSSADIDAAHSGVINTYYNKYQHVILPYLDTTATGAKDTTKKKWWFLAAINGVFGWQAYLGIFESQNLKTPAPGNNGEDVHNDNWTFGVRMAWGIEILSGRGLVAALPTTA